VTAPPRLWPRERTNRSSPVTGATSMASTHLMQRVHITAQISVTTRAWTPPGQSFAGENRSVASYTTA